MTETVSIGFGSFVMTNRIMAIMPPESAPIKRLVSDARAANRLLDSTFGRRTRSVIVTDNGTIILSAITPETIVLRATDDALKNKADSTSEAE